MICASCFLFLLFVMQKTAYDMRISDWSSDVCSSDLLAGLLYLTGGLDNPFAVLILAPVTVSATILSRASTLALSLLALAVVALLPFFHLPLPWPDDSFVMEPMLVLGFAVALVVATLFVATYVFSVSEEAPRMSDALARPEEHTPELQ